MIECERSDDDDDDGGGGRGAEQFSPLPPQLQNMWSDAESSGRGAGNGCAEQARCERHADRSVLLHGLCAVTIALAAARILPASAFTALTALAACLVGFRVLSPVLRTLSCSLFRFCGPCGRRSAEANAIDHGGPRNGGRSVPQRRPPAPPATTTSGGGTLPLVKRGLRLLMRVMRGVQRPFVVRPRRSRRSTRRCHDTASRSVTNVTATETVETVSGSRAGNDYVHCSQRQYQLVRTSRGQR
ncbi:uncharacterized protein LOC100569913 [Acyrthosiphon pisum]|uniref:Uncharacterized protein n=1 Tax=Acyrthosiphon pisum TaxID=7029 RepID=A0A8R2AHG9_ACYPI|nr:uncharacterized protein LOC100569913 [Acyrthosiphon pisum]|eukprot:XP_003246249.1 PREDICTED: uncharacterized protein LOC100569913 [Acyrthosiphon pisum]